MTTKQNYTAGIKNTATQIFQKQNLVCLHNSKPKVILSDKVVNKINALHAVSNVEWSGAIFYKIEGDAFNNGVFYVEEFCLLDEGSSSYTEFEWSSPEISTFLFKNPQYDNHQIGWLHTHHSMQISFSGVDDNALYEQAQNAPYCLSIVTGYNIQKSVAKYAFKTEIETKSIYSVYGQNNQKINKEVVEKKEEVCYFNCDVVFENPITKDLMKLREKNRIAREEAKVKFIPPQAIPTSNYQQKSNFYGTSPLDEFEDWDFKSHQYIPEDVKYSPPLVNNKKQTVTKNMLLDCFDEIFDGVIWALSKEDQVKFKETVIAIALDDKEFYRIPNSLSFIVFKNSLSDEEFKKELHNYFDSIEEEITEESVNETFSFVSYFLDDSSFLDTPGFQKVSKYVNQVVSQIKDRI